MTKFIVEVTSGEKVKFESDSDMEELHAALNSDSLGFVNLGDAVVLPRIFVSRVYLAPEETE